MTAASAVRRHWVAFAATLLFLLSLAIRWPGLVMYDSVGQYDQALTSDYHDWHPPIMARTWALLIHLWPGTAPFFLLQMALWWGGLALIATLLARRERPWAAGAALMLGAFPLFLGWATVVIKDAQMAICLVLAAGLVGWWRLRGRPVPIAIGVIVGLLIAYATLVRGNAAFATVPLALGLIDWFGVRRWWQRGALVVAGIVAVLAVGPILNHSVMKAEAEHNDRSLPLYDIAAIAHLAHTNPPGLAPEGWALAEQRGCYTPFFWNPYGDDRQCGFIGDTLAFDPGAGRTLMREWAMLVIRHPIAYAEHRLGHFNSSLRFLVGMGEPDTIPPVDPEPNTMGLGRPATPGGRILVLLARWTTYTPLGWPVCWIVAGAFFLWALGKAAGEEARLARTLLISALAMSGSFAVASIASDLRYHLWSMVAVGLAMAIGWQASDPRRRAIGGRVTLGVAAVALVAHLVMAPVYVPLPPVFPSPSPASH